jgi:predicted transcriptional regulator
MGAMTKLLERAMEKVREVPAKDQDALASALLSIAGEETAVVRLDNETRAAIEEGLVQAERGEFVPEEVSSRKPTSAPVERRAAGNIFVGEPVRARRSVIFAFA